MAKREWGIKHMCESCGAGFYDLRRESVCCPSCGAESVTEGLTRGRRPEAPVRAAEPDTSDEADDESSAADEEETIDAEDGELEELGDDEEKELIEDTSELGEDEDDMSEVKEHIEEEKA